MQMAISSKKGIQPERLPPTEDAIKYHSFRVYLQIMQWLDIDIEPTEWGWKKEGNILVPVMTDKVGCILILYYQLLEVKLEGSFSDQHCININQALSFLGSST